MNGDMVVVVLLMCWYDMLMVIKGGLFLCLCDYCVCYCVLLCE